MSYDRKIDQVCPHYVIEEALYLTSRQRVRPLRPISSGRSVVVRLNGLVEVPSYGYHTSATALAAQRPPFDIVSGTNDTLVVRVNDGPEQTVTVQGGSQLSARQLAYQLNQKVRGARFFVTPNHRLQLRTMEKGSQSTLVVKSSGSTMASTIGMPTDRWWRGQLIYPGWSLVRDPNTLDDRPSRYIVFDEPLKSTEDYVEISYTTIRQECRRCGGLGYENDWRYGFTGDVIEVRDEALLIQEVLKAVFTIQGSNPFHTWYGTNIINTLGKKISSSGIVQNIIVSDIQDTFRRWQAIKKKQEEDVGQVVSDAEYPFRLLGVKLEQSQRDPTIIYVDTTIQNRSRQPIQIERGVKLPVPADLLGSSAQEGLFRQSINNFVPTG